MGYFSCRSCEDTAGELVGLACRLREPVLRGEGQRELGCRVQADSVSGGDEHRLDPALRAQDASHRLTCVHQRLPVAAFRTRLLVLADERRLGYAERGQVRQYPEMAG